MAWLVVVVASRGVFNSIYQTRVERRRPVAIQRALGARRVQIFSIVLWEALLIAGTGAVAGILCAHAAAGLVGGWFEAQTRVPLVWNDFAVEELYLAVGVTLLGGLAGVLPAWRIARIHVSEGLAPQ
ncbi:MAG: FtsX-like permease family protein [Planctomycetota bacterium]